MRAKTKHRPPLPGPGKKFSLLFYDSSSPGSVSQMVGQDLRVEGGWSSGGGGGGAQLRMLYYLAENGGPWEGFDGAYQEILPAASPFPTSFIWWTDSGKTAKIVEETVTYNPNHTIATDEWKAYSLDGVTVSTQALDTYAYSGIYITSITRAVTEFIHLPVHQLNYLAENGGPWEGYAGAYQEYLPTGSPFPTSIIWWTDSGKTQKIVEQLNTYNVDFTFDTVVWRVYDEDGTTVLATATDTFTYSGVIVTSRTRTMT